MPWCPVCKEEYKEGIITCPECKVELVDALDKIKEAEYQDLITFIDEKLAQKFTEYLKYSKIDAKCREDKTQKDTYIISVVKKDVIKAKKHFNAFYSVEASNAISRNLGSYNAAKEISSEEDEDMSWDRSEISDDDVSADTDDKALASEPSCDIRRPTETYVSMSEKKSDLFSTLVVFSIVGVVGLAVLVLQLLGVFSFMNQMMMILLAAIVLIGVPAVLFTTYKSYKKTIQLAEEEAKLTASLNKWMESVFTKEAVHRLLYSLRVNAPGVPEEQLYLMLNQAMKQRVNDQFGALDDSYLDYIVDTFYDEHFAEEYDTPEEEN